MEALINEFQGFSLTKKILIIAAIPLLLILLYVRGVGALSFLFDSAARAKTDKQSSELDAKIQTTVSQVAVDQGKVEQLEADKAEAIDHEKTDDATDFYNNRFKPDGK